MVNAKETALDYVGGEEEWAKIHSWSKENLPEAEANMYDEMLKGDGWMAAVDVLKQKMKASTPTGEEGTLITGDTPGENASVGYKSRAEMMRDMNNPEYQTDPAFRAAVAQKLAAATFEYDQ